MNFFEHQQKARSRTTLLVILYGVTLLFLIGAIYILFLIIGSMAGGDEFARQIQQNPIQPDLLVLVVGGVSLLVIGGSLFRCAQLKAGGGKAVAEMLGGRLVSPNTADLGERRLYNIVEEIALAAGVPVPPIYIMDNEPSINAFAAGNSINDAVISVNRGSMELLTRDELQGVLGHEYSHIVNGDVKIGIRIMGVLFGLQLLALIGYYCMRMSYYASMTDNRSDNRGGAAGAGMIMLLAGLGVMAIGYIGVFFSAIIKAAVSRERESLADATAVQYTRQTAGIAGALKKIGCPKVGSDVQNPNAAEASHMFFGNVCSLFTLGGLFATHPDLVTRIRALDPNFDGRFPDVIYPVNIRAEMASESSKKRDSDQHGSIRIPGLGRIPGMGGIPGVNIPGVDNTTGAGGIIGGTLAGAILGGMPSDQPAVQTRQAEEKQLKPINKQDTISHLGEINEKQTQVANELLDKIPDAVAETAREPLGAKAAFYAILLDDDETIRHAQVTAIASVETEYVLRLMAGIFGQLQGASVQSRIPLAQRIATTLRQLTPDQYKQFSTTVDNLIAADRKMTLLEYTIKAIMLRNLDIYFGLAKEIGVKYKSFNSVRQSIVGVLSFLAYSGQETQQEVQAAYNVAMKELNLPDPIMPDSQCTVQLFDQALRILSELEPDLKQRFFSALMTCIQHDGQITVKEGELIRAIAAMLVIPMPIFQ